MADIVSSEVRSRMMSGIKGKDTKPEILVRQLLHRAGYRFRLHRKDLPGRPDIVLSRYNAALFVNGCYWHGHEDCHLFRLPKSRQEFWKAKISGNQARDLRKQTELFELGWRVGVVWECTLKGKTALGHDCILRRLEEFIRGDIPFYELRGTYQ
ncbi:T/G mismatch-specific endonuclease [Monaibacterium marinum]|uniref:Very short patch repair endonuclease n=1 Tax=Pontivivens marinum TaxID=1690039 RepID=A0A2C9CW25_9RHOB|nr:very short patch repair endonuclease [Monaibacterium marinum]SOH95514.1 T/G mismatch-specific endonuclease [Monaibacterium marinum]